MNERIISIFTNETEKSLSVKTTLTEKLCARGFILKDDYSSGAELIVCVGGDGAFLETLHKCDFPGCPIVGINTGHLGFFQEILPEGIDRFVEDYVTGNYSIQELNTVKCSVSTGCGKTVTYDALNEITIKGRQSRSVHLHISIAGKPIHKFSGDGILVATSAGSTAYNYSLGGSIVDPRLKLLQVTPMAPMNTTAYRSFTSSILLPADLSIGVVPENTDNTIYINYDSIEAIYTDIKEINLTLSDKVVNLVRFKDYDFWNKVKDKFL
ncbi:MAG: NAD(+)/NADH kinase [Lentihominibacter sp.]|jgi:NAD+ kinase